MNLVEAAYQASPTEALTLLQQDGATQHEAEALVTAWADERNPRAQLASLYLEVARCTRCSGLWHKGWAKGIPPTDSLLTDAKPLSTTRPLMFLGESPGREEAKTHSAFCGPAGQLLNSLLEEAGLPRSTVFVTNPVKCYAMNKSSLNQSAVLHCQPYLLREAQIAHPQFVVCLGRFAWESLFGPHEGTLAILRQTWRAWKLRAWPHELPVTFTYHPAAALRSPERYSAAIRDDLAWTSTYGGDVYALPNS